MRKRDEAFWTQDVTLLRSIYSENEGEVAGGGLSGRHRGDGVGM